MLRIFCLGISYHFRCIISYRFDHIPVFLLFAAFKKFLKTRCFRFIAVLSSSVVDGGSLSQHLKTLLGILTDMIESILFVKNSVIWSVSRPFSCISQSTLFIESLIFCPWSRNSYLLLLELEQYCCLWLFKGFPYWGI